MKENYREKSLPEFVSSIKKCPQQSKQIARYMTQMAEDRFII